MNLVFLFLSHILQFPFLLFTILFCTNINTTHIYIYPYARIKIQLKYKWKKGPLCNWMPTRRHWNHTETMSSFIASSHFFSPSLSSCVPVNELLTPSIYTNVQQRTGQWCMLLLIDCCSALHKYTYNHIHTYTITTAHAVLVPSNY